VSPALRWGLIGASDIAASRVIPAMRELGQAPVAVASRSPERAARYANANDIGFGTASASELLDRDDVDAVYISSTNELHAEQSLAAIAAGKHVLCEKPLALTLDDAASMLTAATSAGKVFAVNHHLPGAGTHRTVRRLLAEGAIGRPLAVKVSHAVSLPARLRGWRLADLPGGGVIMDITCHDASVMNALLGVRALKVTALAVTQGDWASGAPRGAADAAMAVIAYDGEVLAQTHDAFTIGSARTCLEVYGSHGAIIAIDVMTQDPIGTVVLRADGREHEVDVADRRDLYQIALADFAAAARGDGQPSVTGVDGANALAVALAAQRAAATGAASPIDTWFSPPATAIP
jgi:1,5-anhydro-D-fructose reductase (1,5-anhydro-D-mannitol-forming)